MLNWSRNRLSSVLSLFLKSLSFLVLYLDCDAYLSLLDILPGSNIDEDAYTGALLVAYIGGRFEFFVYILLRCGCVLRSDFLYPKSSRCRL